MTDKDDIPLDVLYDHLNGHLPQDRADALDRRARTDPHLAAVIEEERIRLGLLRRAVPAPVAQAPVARRSSWRTAVAAAVCAFALGLTVDTLLPSTPTPATDETYAALIELAEEAHSNSRLRLNLVSQVEHREIDAAELTQATGIRIPTLPEGWTLQDVQVYPSPYGPSIEIAVNMAGNGLISIYAVRVSDDRTVLPVPHDTARLSSAIFQINKTAYVLVGTTAPAPLDDEADQLFRVLL